MAEEFPTVICGKRDCRCFDYAALPEDDTSFSPPDLGGGAEQEVDAGDAKEEVGGPGGEHGG